MKTKVLAAISLLIAVLFFWLPGAALAKERSVIVVFHDKPGLSEADLIQGEKGVIKRTFNHIPAMHVQLSDASIEKIKKDKRVQYVEEDRVVTLVQPMIGPLAGVEYINAWGVLHIGADIAHASGNTGKGIKVAVLDTGIDYTHPDLAANYKGGYNFVETSPPSDPLNPFDDSWNGHGTHVAGTIGAVQNGIGVVGVAPEADLYAVKVMDGGGFGMVSWTIAGIDWAITNGMNILNLSFDSGGDSQALHDACDMAYNTGLLLIAAAGNAKGGPVSYPAAYSSVIAVSATDASDALAYFSSTGPEVELAAPGVNIYSTVPGGGYQTMSGTSMSAPHVTGTAALFLTSNLKDVNGDGVINNEDVRLMLQSTAKDLGTPGRDSLFGFGLVNAAASAGVTVTTITRSHGSSNGDAKTVTLQAGAAYSIRISNQGLDEVDVSVSANGILMKELSSTCKFEGKRPQEVTFSLDSSTTAYAVTFSPHGKTGASAMITISPQ